MCHMNPVAVSKGPVTSAAGAPGLTLRWRGAMSASRGATYVSPASSTVYASADFGEAQQTAWRRA